MMLSASAVEQPGGRLDLGAAGCDEPQPASAAAAATSSERSQQHV